MQQNKDVCALESCRFWLFLLLWCPLQCLAVSKPGLLCLEDLSCCSSACPAVHAGAQATGSDDFELLATSAHLTRLKGRCRRAIYARCSLCFKHVGSWQVVRQLVLEATQEAIGAETLQQGPIP